MADTNPELRAALDAAKSRIEVESYYSKAMSSGVKGNAQGFWGGTALGFLSGSIIGATVIAGFLLTSATLPIAAPLLFMGFVGLGGTAGGAAGARIGAGSAAIAGVAQERERRDKAEKLELEVLASPEKQREVIEAYRRNPVVAKMDTGEELVATSRTPGEAIGKLINWKTVAVAATICAAASMLLFAGGFFIAGGTAIGTLSTPLATGLLNIGVTSLPHALTFGGLVGAAMGTTFGINYPSLFGGLTQHTGDLLGGKTVRGESSFGHIKTAVEMQREANRFQELSSLAPLVIHASATLPSTQVDSVQHRDRVAGMQTQPAI